MNIDAREFSSCLPIIFLEKFYQICINHPKSRMLVLTDNNNIVGLSMIWLDHSEITKKYSQKIFVIIIFYLLWLLLSLNISKFKKIFCYLVEKNAYKIPKKIQPFCVAMTILDFNYRKNPLFILKFFEMFFKNVEELKKKSVAGIWASASKINKESVRMIRNIIKPDSEHLFRKTPEETFCFIWHK